MIVVVLWSVMLFACWNHRLYKAYARLTWHTLLHQVKPTASRDFMIQEQLSAGWIT